MFIHVKCPKYMSSLMEINRLICKGKQNWNLVAIYLQPFHLKQHKRSLKKRGVQWRQERSPFKRQIRNVGEIKLFPFCSTKICIYLFIHSFISKIYKLPSLQKAQDILQKRKKVIYKTSKRKEQEKVTL